MSNVYLFCASLGFLFTVVSAVLSGVFGGGDSDAGVDAGADADVGFDADAGGVDADVGGVDADVGVDAGGVDADVDVGADADGGGHGGASTHLPIFSPTVIAFFLFIFGGTGLLLHRGLGIENPWIHAPASTANALGLGLAFAWALWKLTSTLESNRLARVSDAMAAPAEVTISVPREGMGEIAYVSAGTRQTLSSRSADGKEHRQGASVRVTKIADGVAYVAELPPRPARVSALVAAEPGLEPARGEPVRTRR